VRLSAATRDPKPLTPQSTWYLATAFPRAEVSAEQVDAIDRLRDWIEHDYKPAKHELGWADSQMRPERAIVRHGQLVLLASTLSLLVGAVPARPASREATPAEGKISASQRHRVRGAGHPRGLERGLRRVRAWLCPWARLQLYGTRWSSTDPPPARWPRSSPTWPAPFRLMPRLDQPATK
jgi:hypothetical protein